MTTSWDLAIIGAGSAGYAAALRAAQLGLSVALFDDTPVGGTCLHRGCIPTKAWLQAAKVRRTVEKAGAFGISATLDGTDAGAVRAYADGVVGGLHRGLAGLLSARGVTVIAERATLRADDRGPAVDAGAATHRARAVLVATGAAPVTLGLPVVTSYRRRDLMPAASPAMCGELGIGADPALIRWCFDHRQSAGRGTHTLASSSYWYVPMEAGGDTAKSLGVNTRAVMLVSMGVCSLSAAVAVSFVGIISFVGLVAPHIMRRFVGNDYRYLVPASAVAGALLLILADTFGKWVIAPVVLPIGAITSFLGAPLLPWLMSLIGR